MRRFAARSRYVLETMPELDRVESLFHQALGLPPEVDRIAWLAFECRGNARLLHEVSTLLDAHAKMCTAATSNPALSPLAEPTLPSAQFGVYRAVDLIGRGGMSTVYRAERVDGKFHQIVALKILAGYLADPEFLRRFETERQLLASLNHNNITRLIDGGVSSAGDPYLITELVEGQPIDRYCDDGKLSVKARLELFLQVCDAVDHAHRNLIVHRDLKPANILINRDGIAKLLDFGTASLLAGKTEVTVTRLRMLTPRYASPEQLRGDRVNIATDVFSLGVILYELLSGAWPFGNPRSVLSELSRVATDATAKPPSTVITDESAERRCMPREQLGRMLKGDLGAIVLRALESDPARRYDSVRDFASDVRNFVEGRPVLARPQTAWYRAGKFVRRRWLPVSAAAVFVVGLAGAAIVAVYQARVARAEALKAERVNEFLNYMVSSPAQLAFDPQRYTVAQMLAAAETRLESTWKGDAVTEAALRRSLGNAYSAMGQLDRAEPQLQKALATFQKLGDEKEIAISLYYLAVLAGLDGRPEESVKDAEQALEHARRAGKDMPPQTILYLEDHLGSTLWLVMHRRLPEARALFDEAIALGERDPSIPRTGLASALSHRAGMLADEGNPGDESRLAEAEALYRKALAIGREEDPDGLWQAYPLHFLAILISSHDPRASADLARQYYEVTKRNLGPDHPETAAAELFWMRARADGGDPIDPAQVLQAIETVRKGYRGPSMNLWVALSSAVNLLNRSQKFTEAEAVAREMLPIVDANHLADNDARRGQTWFSFGRALHGEKKDREAAEALKRSASIYDAAGPAWATHAAGARKLLAETHPLAASR